jgi:hypothetical protein
MWGLTNCMTAKLLSNKLISAKIPLNLMAATNYIEILNPRMCPIGKVIFRAFYPYIERPNQNLYAY